MHKALLPVIVVCTVSLHAQVARKPWMFTIDERIALRTNPELARARVREAASATAASAKSTNADVQPWVDHIAGKTHPELFLPNEVFDQLIKLAFLSSSRTGQTVRDGLMPEVKRHGLPADFWQRLQSLSAVYSADTWAVRDLLASISKQSGAAKERAQRTLDQQHWSVCRSRADALRAAHGEFGPERFDSFLYEAVAVGMFASYDRIPEPELLRRSEEGCR